MTYAHRPSHLHSRNSHGPFFAYLNRAFRTKQKRECGGLENLSREQMHFLPGGSRVVNRSREDMEGSTPSLAQAHDLLRELRQRVRRIEVAQQKEKNNESWTSVAIEVQCSITAGNCTSLLLPAVSTIPVEKGWKCSKYYRRLAQLLSTADHLLIFSLDTG